MRRHAIRNLLGASFCHLGVLTLFAVMLGLGLSTPLQAEETFTVHLPGIHGAQDDSITVPKGRPIYAILVSGYARNANFDELHFYNFATFLMEQGAYVHYAWWNNLLAPYMERPLHDASSHPGDLVENAGGFVPVKFLDKAIPDEDFQFQADAEAFLQAIRGHNPHAGIILVGHSMGGESVARLGANTRVDIDLLAPIDPVGNRSLPVGIPLTSQHNWTRWRATRNEFGGYLVRDCERNDLLICRTQLVCDGILDCHLEAKRCFDFLWRPDLPPPPISLAPILCPGGRRFIVPPKRSFGSHIRYLYHRWQKESEFPFDYFNNEFFDYPAPLADSLDGPN